MRRRNLWRYRITTCRCVIETFGFAALRATIGNSASRRVFLSAEWRDLILLTYRADPALLDCYLPPGVKLDTWEGQSLVSLVAFRFLRSRLLSVPIPFHGDFPEVNLRFYVTRETAEGVRRGVVFIKEIVPRSAVSAIARSFYNENYYAMPMSYTVEPGLDAEYRWKHAGKWNRVRASSSGGPRFPAKDSLEYFLLDHHWGYSCTRRGLCAEYQVERPEWRTYPVKEFHLDADLESAYQGFGCALDCEPLSAVYAEGSHVTVSHPRILTRE